MSNCAINVTVQLPAQVTVTPAQPPNVNVQLGGAQGVSGPIGPTGPTGPQGPAGGATDGTGDLNFAFQQESSSTVWYVVHNLGKFPSVTIITSAGQNVEGDIFYVDSNNLILTFSAAFAGVAYLN